MAARSINLLSRSLSIVALAVAATASAAPGSPAAETTCGRGRPRTAGPYVDAGGPDENYTRDGCYAIAGENVIRRGTDGRTLWSRALGEELGGVRPPHILHDAARVYVTQGNGVTAIDVERGEVLWSSAGPHDRMLLRKELLLATECGSSRAMEANGRFMTARAVADGCEVFRVKLPAGVTDPWPIWEFGGLFVVQEDSPSIPDSVAALIVDHRGQVRFRLKRTLVDGVLQGSDVVLLMDGEVARLTPSGTPRWSFRSIYSGGAGSGGGGLVQIPGGDLIAYEYDIISDSGVGLQRFDANTGTKRWSAYCKPLGVAHSLYRHRATVTVEAGQLKVSSRGSYGTFEEWLDLQTGKQVRRIQD